MPFDFGYFIKQFFGLNEREIETRNYPKDYWDTRLDEDENTNGEGNGKDVFDIFEPFDMHRHFEQQIGDIFRLFGNTLIEPPFSNGEFHINLGDEEPPQKSIRDEYLKPGFQSKHHNKDNVKDSDLDGMIAPQDLDIFMKKDQVPERGVNILVPANPHSGFFGRTVITRTIIKPDGTQETHRTVRDSRTNEEETTVTITQRGNGPNNPNFIPPSDGNLWEKFFGNK